MESYNIEIENCKGIISRFPNRDYPLESSEGKILQDAFLSLSSINDICLSPEERIQKDSLLMIIGTEKLRRFI